VHLEQLKQSMNSSKEVAEAQERGREVAND
jgi:hypothetical protein